MKPLSSSSWDAARVDADAARIDFAPVSGGQVAGVGDRDVAAADLQPANRRAGGDLGRARIKRRRIAGTRRRR